MALSRSMKNMMHDSAMARRGGGNPSGGGGLRRAMERGGIMGGQYNPGPKLQPRGPMPDRGPGGRMGGGNRGPRGPVKPTAPSRFGQGMKKLGQQGGMASMIRRAREQSNPTTGGAGGPVLRPSPGGAPPTGGGGGIARQALARAKMQQAQQRGGGGGGMMRPAVQPPQRGGGGGVMGRGVPAPGTPIDTRMTATAARASTAMGKPRPGAGTFGFAAQRGAAPAMPGPAALAKPQGQSVASRIGGQQGPPARRSGMARALGSGGSRRRMLR